MKNVDLLHSVVKKLEIIKETSNSKEEAFGISQSIREVEKIIDDEHLPSKKNYLEETTQWEELSMTKPLNYGLTTTD